MTICGCKRNVHRVPESEAPIRREKHFLVSAYNGNTHCGVDVRKIVLHGGILLDFVQHTSAAVVEYQQVQRSNVTKAQNPNIIINHLVGVEAFWPHKVFCSFIFCSNLIPQNLNWMTD